MKKKIRYFSLLYGVDSIILFKEASYKKKKKALLLVADLQTSGLLFPFFYSFTPVFPRVALFLFILSCSCTCLL